LPGTENLEPPPEADFDRNGRLKEKYCRLPEKPVKHPSRLHGKHRQHGFFYDEAILPEWR
jgi:hypothetical protein